MSVAYLDPVPLGLQVQAQERLSVEVEALKGVRSGAGRRGAREVLISGLLEIKARLYLEQHCPSGPCGAMQMYSSSMACTACQRQGHCTTAQMK